MPTACISIWLPVYRVKRHQSHTPDDSGRRPGQVVRGLPDTLLVKIPRKRISDNYDDEVPLNQLRHPSCAPVPTV